MKHNLQDKKATGYRRRHIGTLLLTLALGIPAWTQAADNDVTLNAAFKESSARQEEHATLVVTLDIPKGYHLYSMTKITDGPLPLKLSPELAPPLSPSTEWYGTPPVVQLDPNFNKAVELYDGTAEYQRGFSVSKDAAGEVRLPIEARGQICNEDRCIPFRDRVVADLRIDDGPPRAARQTPPELSGVPFPKNRKAPTAADVTEKAALNDKAPPLGEGFVGFIIIAFLAGLGALVTPCVFPMIPITVSFFSKFSKVSIRRSAAMASIYAGSIVSTFTLLGVLVSVIFGAVGMQTLSASAGFNIFLTLLLAVFAFNLFGLFEIQMPSWLVAKTSAKERSLSGEDGSLVSQAAGVFFMAVTFTLVSFTCTVGFIGVVLAEASKGNWFYPALGMLMFSIAFSLPFFFLALFPSVADKLRGKGGDWMVAVKVTLGFLELAGAFKFLSNVDLLWQWHVVTRPLVLAIWTALFTAAGLYLLRIFNLPLSDPDTRHVGPLRMFVAVMLLALAIYSATGIRDSKSMGGWLDGWLPPAVYPGDEVSTDDAHLEWIVDDIERGFTVATHEKKPLFIDFTGYTCTNCRYMEGSVFPKPEVRSRLEKMVRVTLYTDCEQTICETQRQYQLERFDTAALPLYAIIDPYSDTVLAVHPDMTKDIDAYTAFLDKGLDAFERVMAQRAAPPLPAVAPSAENQGAPDGGAKDMSSPEASAGEIQLKDDGAPVDFSFPSLFDGTQTALSDYRGKWVFLNFWASWCAPCKHELKIEFPPALEAAPHIQLLTVAFDGDDTKGAAIDFAREAGLSTDVVLQGGEDITAARLSPAFDISENLPISYLIHPKGHIAWQRTGSVDKALLTRLFSAASAAKDK